MTAPTSSPSRADTGALAAPEDDRRRRTRFVLATLAIAAATVLLRAVSQQRAYDVFIDEIQYADVANSFAAGTGPRLFGAPFFLHPPLFFALVGMVIGHPVPHVSVGFVLGLRWVNLVPAALNTLLVIAVARRVAGRGAAVLAGVVYAVDPFVVRFDSRLMLEAPAMCAVLAGVLAGTVAIDRAGPRHRQRLLAVMGLAFGAAVLVKSTAVLVTAVPLLLMLATGWGLRRLEAALVLAVQAGVYALYLAWVATTGQIADWYQQNLAGAARATGVVTQTGFNAAGTPAFADRLLANLDLLAPSYVLIGVGTVATIAWCVTGWRSLRVPSDTVSPDRARSWALLLTWLAGVVLALAYTCALGEVEEQSFYLMAVPSAIVLGVLADRAGSWRRGVRVALAGVLALGLAAGALTWTRLRTGSDDAYAQMVGYLERTVPAGTPIALGEVTGQFVLPEYPLAPLRTIADARRGTARYALVSTQLSAIGLAPASSALIHQLDERYTVIHTVRGRSVGELRLYDLDHPRTSEADR